MSYSKTFKKAENDFKFFTEEEFSALFTVIEADTSKYAIRNEALFKICFDCALRVSEIGLLKIGSIRTVYDHEHHQSTVIDCKRLKNGKSNSIKLVNQDTLNALNRYLQTIDTSDSTKPLFQSQMKKPISRKTLDSLIKSLCKRAGLSDKKKWHFHVLRHTKGIQLAENGFDLKELQWYLGHRNVENTLVYFEFTSGQQEKLFRKAEQMIGYKR